MLIDTAAVLCRYLSKIIVEIVPTHKRKAINYNRINTSGGSVHGRKMTIFMQQRSFLHIMLLSKLGTDSDPEVVPPLLYSILPGNLAN